VPRPNFGFLFFFVDGGAQNVADFLFHAAAVAAGAALEAGFDGVFEIADDELGHIDIMISAINFLVKSGVLGLAGYGQSCAPW